MRTGQPVHYNHIGFWLSIIQGCYQFWNPAFKHTRDLRRNHWRHGLECFAHSLKGVNRCSRNTHRPSVNNYESLGVWIEITIFDGFGLTWNYVAQIVFRFFTGPEGKLGLDIAKVRHPFCGIFHDVIC